MINLLRSQGIKESLLEDLISFRKFYKVDEIVNERIQKPKVVFYGKDIWEMAIAALLEGEHLLLSGPKATGKNVLADNLAYAFNRPSWTVSFHSNIDSTTLIGTDTLIGNEVVLRRGSVYECAIYGGFGIFDEINMAKNDSIAVLHSALDYRKIIDIPGYEKVNLHDATRFIGTMNYGYAGTKELNEALVSRFMVINIPSLSKEKIKKIILEEFPDIHLDYLEQFAGLFLDLQQKSGNSEITPKAVDFRGLLGAMRTIKRGLRPYDALNMGIVGKTFDEFEKEILHDVLSLRISPDITSDDIFKKN